MKELSLNILDIVENSVTAGASLTDIGITETDTLLTLTIRDNGCGMTQEQVRSVMDPFFTTRTTRKVGMGIPLLRMEAEMTGGQFTVTSADALSSPDCHGTTVTAVFHKDHIDCLPLGDVISTLQTLIQGHPDTDFCFIHRLPDRTVQLDTRELRQVLEDVPLNTYEVLSWIGEYLGEQYA